MHGELNQLIPSFVKRAQVNDYLVGISATAAEPGALKHVNVLPVNSKNLSHWWTTIAHAEEKVIAVDPLSACAAATRATARDRRCDERE